MKSSPVDGPASSGASVAALRALDAFQRALDRRDRVTMVAGMGELLALDAPLGGQWLQATLIAAEIGEVALARQAVDRFVAQSPDRADALFRKAGVLAHLNRFGESLELLRGLSPEVPDRFAYALCRGANALNVGEAEEAREWLGRAVTLRPTSGSAWHSLSLLLDFAVEDDLFARMAVQEAAIAAAPPQDRATYYYALGKGRADRGDHAGAFAAVSRAASETRALFPFRFAAEQQEAAEGLHGYDRRSLAGEAAGPERDAGQTIFIMGTPRSGSTLVSQVLTAHSAVKGGAELNLARILVHEAGNASRSAVDSYMGLNGSGSLAGLWRHLLDQRFPGEGRVVDKTLDNSRRLGLIATVLPDAPLVWLCRNPLDAAWSCYRTCFMNGIAWSNDLVDIARVFRLEDELLKRWQDLLGERLLVLSYENFASQPDREIPMLLAHCGLPDEPQVHAPHENRQEVATASVMQVRRPLHRSALGAAEPYREFLQPFVDAYSA